MPSQEVFFEQERNGQRLEVIKTYGVAFAREAFAELNGPALDFLANALGVAESYERSELPNETSPEFADFLWQELLDSAREDGNTLSFFIVQELRPGAPQSLYISPDWPSAAAFAKSTMHLT